MSVESKVGARRQCQDGSLEWEVRWFRRASGLALERQEGAKQAGASVVLEAQMSFCEDKRREERPVVENSQYICEVEAIDPVGAQMLWVFSEQGRGNLLRREGCRWCRWRGFKSTHLVTLPLQIPSFWLSLPVHSCLCSSRQVRQVSCLLFIQQILTLCL